MHGRLSRSVANAALGRSSLLSSQPDKPVAPPRQRGKFSVLLRDDLQGSGHLRPCRLVGGDDDAADRPFLFRAQGLRPRSTTPLTTTSEEIKVGYNLRRKVALLSIWALSPLPLYFDPTYFGLFAPAANTMEFVRHVAAIWLALGIGGVLFRTVQLFIIKDVLTGLVWATKILTDPFHDIKLYHKAPLALLRGEIIDRSIGAEWDDEDAEALPRIG